MTSLLAEVHYHRFSHMDPLIFAILAAFVPAFGWLVYFYRKDRLNPEPTRVVLAFFIWGGAFGVPAALLLATVTEPTVESLNIDTTGFIGVFLLFFLLAGLPEETMKGLLAAFRARKEPHIDEPADPMLYFTSLGLGFGAVETTMYLLVFSDQFAEIAILRAVTATVGHGLWTGITGYFYGAKRFGMNRYMGLISGILIAATAHGLYDAATNYDLLLAIGVLVVTALLYGWLFKNALKHSPHAVVLTPPATPPAAPPPTPA